MRDMIKVEQISLILKEDEEPEFLLHSGIIWMHYKVVCDHHEPGIDVRIAIKIPKPDDEITADTDIFRADARVAGRKGNNSFAEIGAGANGLTSPDGIIRTSGDGIPPLKGLFEMIANHLNHEGWEPGWTLIDGKRVRPPETK